MSLKRYGAREADVTPLIGRTIAVLGYGSQGSAHAKNLRDSGCTVVVGQRPAGPRHEAALADGFTPTSLADATRDAQLVILALPDDKVGPLFRAELASVLRPGQALGFIHGFAIHYKLVEPPADVDVVLVAPKAQGAGVRSLFVAGRGPAALLAVHQDATGNALQTALAWAGGIGAGRAGILETTFRDETETDLFGEQSVLCGGLSGLITAAFETLVAAGYPAELAYFECCHEVKLLADLIQAGGITAMRERISSTARFGDLTRGPRIADERVRATLREILGEIQDGRFADEFLRDAESGGRRAAEAMAAGARHSIETVGREMRRLAMGQGGE